MHCHRFSSASFFILFFRLSSHILLMPEIRRATKIKTAPPPLNAVGISWRYCCYKVFAIILLWILIIRSIYFRMKLLTIKIIIWKRKAKITSVAFRSKEIVDAFSNWRALVKQTWTTKLSNPLPINMLQSWGDVGNICLVAISPSIITAAVNVEKNPMHPNKESIVDQCKSEI